MTKRIFAAALLFLGLAVASPLNAAINDGLVAYWPLEGNFEDALGTYHGESSEFVDDAEPIEFVDGRFGQSVRLNGENQSIYINGGEGGNDPSIEDPGGVADTIEDRFDFAFVDGEENTGSFAVSTWFTLDAFDTSWQCLVCKGEGSGWRLHRRGGEAELAFTGGTGGDGDANGVAIEPNPDGAASQGDDLVWHHVVAITNGALIHSGDEGDCDLDAVNAGEAECMQAKQVWLDGQLITTAAGNMLENRGNLMQIGDNPDSANREWEGHIDDVAVWERALTRDEVLSLYNDGAGNSLGFLLNPGLVGDFNGDDAVDMADFNILVENFNSPGDSTMGDIDFNNQVNLTDFLKFREAFASAGAAGAAAASVPEPSGLVLIALASIVPLLSRRRKR